MFVGRLAAWFAGVDLEAVIAEFTQLTNEAGDWSGSGEGCAGREGRDRKVKRLLTKGDERAPEPRRPEGGTGLREGTGQRLFDATGSPDIEYPFTF